MSGKMARDKGKRGEREIADRFIAIMEQVEKELWKKGYSEDVKRNTLQSDRGGFDLVGIPGLAIEVKRCETLQLGSWWQQCCKQAKDGLLPVLFYRQNNRAWKVRTYTQLSFNNCTHWIYSDFDADDFFIFYKQYYYNILFYSV